MDELQMYQKSSLPQDQTPYCKK